jgi:hypothetical protein
MKTQKWKTMVTTALAVGFSASAATAAEERKDGMRFIPDVIEAFGALSEAPETLGFHITTTPDPSFCKHYQAIVRVNGADGTPFFLVTKSGNNPAYTVTVSSATTRRARRATASSRSSAWTRATRPESACGATASRRANTSTARCRRRGPRHDLLHGDRGRSLFRDGEGGHPRGATSIPAACRS